MLGWKIIVTVLITLGLIVTYVGTTPALSGFFDTVRDRLGSFTGDSAPRDIEFTLATDKYGGFDFSGGPMNITITGSTTATLKTGNLVTNKTVGIHGFRGSGKLESSRITLDGRMSKVELPEITVGVQETIKSESAFTSLSISGLHLKEYKLRNVSGTLTARTATTQFSGDIILYLPSGNFTFSDALSISGTASKIALSSGLVIE